MPPEDAKTASPAPPAPKPAPPSSSEAGSTQPKKLTPEEQMALYEDSLKETDWGHQPC